MPKRKISVFFGKLFKVPLLARGFTMIELLVVVAIMVIMSALILPRLLSSNVRKEFDSTVETIFYSLNQARERAASWQNGTTWGVYFQRYNPVDGCNSKPNFGIFFTNTGYSDNTKINFVSYLPVTMDFDVTSTWGANALPGDCYRIIDFKEVTGENWFPNSVSTSSVKVYILKNPLVSSTISVTPLGMVSYTTSTPQ